MKKTMRKLIIGLLILTMMATFTGCGASEEAEKPTNDSSQEDVATGEDITIGVVLKTLSSEYWNYVAAGVEAAGKDLGVNVKLQGPASETAYDEQTNMLETMLSAGDIDALVVAPLQPDSVVAVLGDTSVPILFVDTDAPYDNKKSYIGTGNYEAAYQGGEYAAKEAGEGSKAVFIGGVQGNTTNDERQKGFTDAFNDNGVELVATQYADGLADKATNIMENLLTSLNNDIDIVVSTNDDIAAGVARAVNEAGVEDVIIIGFDGIQAGVENIINGTVSGTVAQSPFGMGYQAVENAVKVAKGEDVEDFVDTGSKVINSGNAEEYLEELKKMLGK